MRPVLYDRYETKYLDYGLGEIDFSVATVKRERNGSYTFYGEYPINGKFSEILQEQMQLKSDAGVRTKWQTFEITRINKKSDGVIKVYADHVSQSTTYYGLRPSVGVSNSNAQAALTVWKNNLIGDGTFDVWSDVDTVATTRWEIDKVHNAREALGGVAGSILDVWGGEYEFDNRTIRLHKRLGRKSPVPIEYGRNLVSAEVDDDIASTYTSVMPYAMHTDQESGIPITYTLDEMIVDSEHTSKYKYRRILKVNFSEEFDTDEPPSQDKLRSLAESYIKSNGVGIPRTNLKASYIDLSSTMDYEDIQEMEEVELCDILPIYYHDLGITDSEAKVTVIEYDVLREVNESIEVGSIGQSFRKTLTSGVQGQIDTIAQWQQNTESELAYILNARGNRIWRTDPRESDVEHKDGDIWFEKNGLYERIWIYDASQQQWIMRMDTEDTEVVKRRIDEVEKEADRLAEDIEASDQKADEAKEAAGLAKSASESAEAIAQQAQTEAESAKSSSNEALEKVIIAGTDAETAKQNALDAVSQVSEAKQNASEALGKAGEAVSKANDAIGKANRIPQDIQNEIESKGLASGSWVESHVNDVTGEINYALAEVSGSIPRVILGVVWDKSENPILTRTDYVEEYANLTDYLLKTNEIDYSIEGLSGHISRVETNKLDSAEFTSFKTNDYDVTVEGFRTAITDKLDEETFSTFKTNEFDVTVEGINGNIESLQTDKLDSTDFNTFKSNDYELTVDGLRMDLTSVSGSIPTIVMGVEWDKSQNPELTRTDYLEYDNPNLYSPSFIMGVRWDKSENPKLYRTDDTGGVDDYEYSQQTAQFVNDISGISGRVENVETNKLGTNEFNSFKTNTYAVDLEGLRTNITSLDEGKLGSDEFSNFKTNVFDVSVSGLSGRIGTVETEKLDSGTYDNFKTNTYDVDVSGLKSRMSSVESKKLDSGTFETFRDTTYTNTIEGITGSITTLQDDKLDNNDFNSFKQNEYELTVDGLKMSLTEVTGVSPTIVLGVEWDKSSDPSLERTDFSVGYADSDEFESLQADYNFTKESWSTRLQQIENAGYATQSWSNQTFATPQSVTTQLQAYARTTDLNGMVTETTLATKNYMTAGAVSTLLTSYAKTGDVPTATQFNSLKNRYDSMEQTIGTTNDSVARAIMTSSLWETEVTNVIQSELAETTKNETAYVEVTSRSGLENLLMGGAYSTNIVLDPIRTGEALLVYIDVEPSALGTGNGTMQVEYGGVTSSPVTIYKSLGRSEYSMVLTIPADNSRTGLFRFSYNFDSIYSWGNIRGVRVEKATTIQVPAGTGAISSKITQLYDQISMALTGADGQIAHLIANASGVSIKGEIIHLDGKVKMDEGFARKFMVEEMTADTVNAFSATFANAIVGNLDVNNIAGNKASFIQMLLNGVNTSLRATSDVVDIMRNDGTISTRLTQNGMEIWRDGAKVGDFESRSSISQSGAFRNKKSVSITPERDSYISLGYYQAGQTTSTRVLSIAGDTGMLYLSSPIYPSESSTYGLNIQRFTLNGGGGIRVGSTGGSSGIFFGDSGQVSIQFNGTWYSTDRLIN